MKALTGFLLGVVAFLTLTCIYEGFVIHQQEVAIEWLLLGNASEK